jgi:hypothetical protein
MCLVKPYLHQFEPLLRVMHFLSQTISDDQIMIALPCTVCPAQWFSSLLDICDVAHSNDIPGSTVITLVLLS